MCKIRFDQPNGAGSQVKHSGDLVPIQKFNLLASIPHGLNPIPDRGKSCIKPDREGHKIAPLLKKYFNLLYMLFYLHTVPPV